MSWENEDKGKGWTRRDWLKADRDVLVDGRPNPRWYEYCGWNRRRPRGAGRFVPRSSGHRRSRLDAVLHASGETLPMNLDSKGVGRGQEQDKDCEVFARPPRDGALANTWSLVNVRTGRDGGRVSGLPRDGARCWHTGGIRDGAVTSHAAGSDERLRKRKEATSRSRDALRVEELHDDRTRAALEALPMRRGIRELPSRGLRR